MEKIRNINHQIFNYNPNPFDINDTYKYFSKNIIVIIFQKFLSYFMGLI